MSPAFVVDAAAMPSDFHGRHEVVGVAANGDVLFRQRVAMDEIADAGLRSGQFVTVVPLHSTWERSLARIVLAGPEGTVEMGRDTEPMKALVTDARTGRLRAILGGPGVAAELDRGEWTDGVEVMWSTGTPPPSQWTSARPVETPERSSWTRVERHTASPITRR